MSLHNLPSSTTEWVLFDHKIRQMANLQVDKRTRIVISIVMCTSPLSALLYAACAWKKIRQRGAWLVRLDGQGYMYPNTYVAIAFCAILYNLTTMTQAISFMSDFKTRLHACSTILEFVPLPMLIIFGWTKIWTLAYAMPPSKYSLNQINLKIGKPNAHASFPRFLPPLAFNLVVILGYAVQLISLSSIVTFGKTITRWHAAWESYDGAFLQVVNSAGSPVSIEHSQHAALTALEQLSSYDVEIKEKLHTINVVFLIIALFQFFCMFMASYRIQMALLNQVFILRNALKRQKNMEAPILDHSSSNVTFDMYKLRNLVNISSSPRGPGSFTSSEGSTVFDLNWRMYLPSFTPGSGVSASTWTQGPFQQSQQEILDGGSERLAYHYRQLARYVSNTFWQTILVLVSQISYAVLLFMLLFHGFGELSFARFTSITTLWINVTWNLGVGIVLGIIACIVVYSPTPSLPREPSVANLEGEDLY